MFSSIPNPLVFFENFFPDGFDKLYQDFFNFNTKKVTGTSDNDYCEEPYYMIECNREQGYIIIEEAAFANVDLEVHQFKKNFRDELEAILIPEIDASLKLIISEIQTKGSREGQETYIHTILTEIEFIINNKVKLICSVKYQSQCKAYLIQYMRLIEQRYSYLVNDDASYMKLLKEPVQNEFTTLLIVSYKQDLIPKLYDKLKPKFIDEDTSLETFTKAFTGVILKEGESLDIKWLPRPFGSCFIAALVVMLDHMVIKGYLNQYNDKQLSNIFVTDEGGYIKPTNWKKRRKEANRDDRVRGEPDEFWQLKAIIDNLFR